MDSNVIIDEVLQGRLSVFFKTNISPDEMAKYIRRVNYVLSTLAMRQDLTDSFRLNWVEDGFYWLNELAEVLDPMINLD